MARSRTSRPRSTSRTSRPRSTSRVRRLASARVTAYNRPWRTPEHPTKSHMVIAKVGNVVKTIRFGQQGAKTAGRPKRGESERMKAKRRSFKARHAANIARGPISPAWWADKYKW